MQTVRPPEQNERKFTTMVSPIDPPAAPAREQAGTAYRFRQLRPAAPGPRSLTGGAR